MDVPKSPPLPLPADGLAVGPQPSFSSEVDRPRRRRVRIGRLGFLLPAAALLGLISVYPFTELLRMSVSEVGAANLLDEWPFVGVANFGAILASPEFREAAVHTVVFVLVVLIGGLGAGLACALVLKTSRRTTRIAEALMVLAWALPPVVSGSLWKFLFSGDGVVNALLEPLGFDQILFLADPSLALLSVAFVSTWVTVPFAAVVLKAGILDLPAEVHEAARMDGANWRQVTRFVTLPLLRPVILVLGVLITVYAFRSFDLIFVMTAGGPGTASATIPFLAYKTAIGLFRFDEGAAMAVVAAVAIGGIALYYAQLTRAGADR